METSLEARGRISAITYLKLFRGYELISNDINGLVVAYDPDKEEMVFIDIKVFEKPVDEIDFKKDFDCNRKRFERAMWELITDPDYDEGDMRLRTDQLAVCIAGNNRGMISHHINANLI